MRRNARLTTNASQVSAVSRGVESNESAFQAATRPLAPALRAAAAAQRALRLAWSSDVNSRQDRYELRYRRRPPAGAPAADEEPYRTVSAAHHPRVPTLAL